MSTRLKMLAVSCVAALAVACGGGEKPPIQQVDDTGTAVQDTGAIYQDTGADQEDTSTGTEDTGGGVTDTGLADTGGADTGGGDTGMDMDTGGGDSGMDMDTGPQCPNADEEYCSGPDMCVNTQQALDHCGSCGNACPDLPGTSKTCLSGSCSYTCTRNFEDANGDLSDPANSDGCEKMVGNCTPTTEVCNGKDDDCNGVVDDPWKMQLGASCQSGMGVCKQSGTMKCNQAQDGVICDPGPGQPTESTEKSCDGKDNDCDGKTDEGCDDDGDGICDANMTYTAQASCNEGPNGKLDCDDSPSTGAQRYPGHPGACDGIDNDCDLTKDDLEEVPGATHNFKMKSKEKSGWGKGVKRVAVAPAGNGFCAAFLHENKNQVEFVRALGDGTSTVHIEKFGGNNPKTLLDIGWSGTNCALVYSSGSFSSDDLFVARWKPGQAKTYKLKLNGQAYDRTGVYYWVQHSAIHYTGSRWVVATVEDTSGKDEVVFFKFRDGFKSSTNPSKTEIAKVSHKSSNNERLPELDVGPSPNSSDDFAIFIRGRFGGVVGVGGSWEARLYSVLGKTATHQKNAVVTKNADKLRRPVIGEIDGDVYLSHYDSTNDRRIVRLLSGSTYKPVVSSKVASTSPDHYTNQALFGGTKALGNWLVETYQDEVHTFDRRGSIFNFNLQNHNQIGGSDEVLSLTPHGSKDRMFIFTLTNKRPYEAEINGFTCY